MISPSMTSSRIEQVTIRLPASEAAHLQAQRSRIATTLRINAQSITDWKLVKRSIDARQRQVMVQMVFLVSLGASLPQTTSSAPDFPILKPSAPSILVIGCGPAGLFAAHECLRNGLRPILLERGKDVSARRFDLAPIFKHGRILEDSNYAFGEGGAGTFSDGKLYTRATKRGPVAKVYQTLFEHGAPEEILVDAHPHIGSNLLPNVVRNMRQSIQLAGGEVHFETKVVDFLLKNQTIQGVVCSNGKSFESRHLILATGHSARDIYRLLNDRQIRQEAKPFAMGVRLEHPQPLVDRHQYHLKGDQPRPDYLPAASYRLATKIKNRGVHSFCMCPGGFIVPAATENHQVVVNGMSLSRRDSPFANSGMVVTVEPEDMIKGSHSPSILAGMHLQESLEMAAKKHGGEGQKAPAQRVTDFLNAKISTHLPSTSYRPGVERADLAELLPEGITWRLKQGLLGFEKQFRGYLTEEALMVGFETRTSSPLRIPRDPESLQHPDVKGLYPCGEGAGFAGGIVSAALDGMRCAQAVTLQVGLPIQNRDAES